MDEPEYRRASPAMSLRMAGVFVFLLFFLFFNSAKPSPRATPPSSNSSSPTPCSSAATTRWRPTRSTIFSPSFRATRAAATRSTTVPTSPAARRQRGRGDHPQRPRRARSVAGANVPRATSAGPARHRRQGLRPGNRGAGKDPARRPRRPEQSLHALPLRPRVRGRRQPPGGGKGAGERRGNRLTDQGPGPARNRPGPVATRQTRRRAGYGDKGAGGQ